MKYEDKTKEQLINELVEMQRRVTELEASEMERKQAEEEIFRLASIVESSDDAIIGKTLDGIILSWNKGAERIYGYVAEEVKGQPISVLIPPGRPDEILQILERVKQGEEIERYETVRIRKDGKQIPVSLTISPIKDTAGKITGVSTIARDITERKRAEEILRESEEKFRTLAGQSPNMVFINKKGKVVYANEKSEEIMGYKRDEFYSPDFDFLNLIAPESVELVKSSISKHMKGEEVEPYECTLTTKDDKRIEAIIATRLIDYEEERAILGILTDITQRKQVEEEIKKYQKRIEALINSSSDLIFLKDKDFRYLIANKVHEKLFNIKIKDIIGKTDFDFMPKEVAEGCRKSDEEVLKSKELIEKEEYVGDRCFQVVKQRVIDATGNIIGIAAVIRDITQRKQVEEALKQSEEKYRSLVESSEDSIYLVDRNCEYLFMNNKHLSRLGLQMSQLMGRTYSEFHSLEETKEFVKKVREVLETGKWLWYEYRSQRDNRYFIRTLSPVKHPETGIATAVTVISKDITQRKEAEEEKEKARAQLLMAHKSLEKVHLELKTLWQSSKEILCKESLSEIINRSYEIIQSLFPDAHIFVSLLEPKKQDLFPLERLNLPSKIVDGQRHFQPPNGLIDWLASIKNALIIEKDPSTVLDKFLHQYPLWYALPIVAESGCIGCVIMAFDKEKYIPKSDLIFVNKLLSQIAGPISQAISMEGKIEALKERTFARTSFHGLVGQSKAMQDIYDLIRDVAPTSATALITGENGTGKELAATAIHECSTRRDGPFVVANCSAYPITLFESELFGHEKGAFTGAIRTKRGRFELAHNGTIFLDEIGEIPQTTQLLLLRVLQNRCFERIGGEKTIEVNVRVIAATNKDLKKEMTAGRFREDLYYRLNVVHIHMPPLREKEEDIPLLCDYFLKKFCEETGREVKGFTAQAMRSLIDYNWPGNVRELENVIQQAIILAKKDTIGKEVLPSSIKGFRRMPVSLAEHEGQFILRVLKECNLNKHEAARRLKISRATLYSKIKRHGLEKIVIFRFEAPEAKSVYLVGSFNQWNATALPMKKEESGIWKIDAKLAPGTYEYLFYVDGNWQNDPAAEIIENPFGTVNNVLVVR